MDYVETPSISDEFSIVKRYTNSCNFTDEQLRRRENELKELQRLYPSTCISMLELAWNFCEYTPKEEQDKIIREKLWEQPGAKRMSGGTIKNAMSISSTSDNN